MPCCRHAAANLYHVSRLKEKRDGVGVQVTHESSGPSVEGEVLEQDVDHIQTIQHLLLHFAGFVYVADTL